MDPTYQKLRLTTEGNRILGAEADEGWKEWGPYVSERQWGTVREDYSPQADAWNHVSYEKSRLYAYRWGEDGLGGFSDSKSRICLSLALWNGKDDHLKEKLFGLPNNDGNHGEDVKEIYYYLDSTPTHSYCKMQYLYPQAKFPYEELKYESNIRSRMDAEYELSDTGVFDENRYFQVDLEYAKAATHDIIASYTITNKGPETAKITVIPQITLRNTWAHDKTVTKPLFSMGEKNTVKLETPYFEEDYTWISPGASEYLFTENETNTRWLYGNTDCPVFTKEGFHRYFVQNEPLAVNTEKTGTKVGAVHKLSLAPGESRSIKCRLAPHSHVFDYSYIDHIIATRKDEANTYYNTLQCQIPNEDEKKIQRQALAGMMWSKQFYYYDVEKWLKGDDLKKEDANQRKYHRNKDWQHLKNADIISMPDKWEYPWYAAWDLAFHCIPIALIDAHFAKRQLILMLKERYQHPNGQIPAYEWNFSDVNPPVHAWACHRVFQMDKKRSGVADYFFLERAFHKLMINFTWWVNRKDVDGNNVFQGGFLGLDNIGLFDRSAPLPNGGHIDQADGTAWMAFYSLSMMKIALELAQNNSVYEHTATKFLEHFLHIAEGLNSGKDGHGLWDDKDGFYYDILRQNGKDPVRLKVRSMVGIIPLFAVEILEDSLLDKVPHFRTRLEWLFDNRPDFSRHVSYQQKDGKKKQILSIVSQNKLERILDRIFDDDAFFSDFGIRSLSKEHLQEPYTWNSGKFKGEVKYIPGESESSMFGGNSNWRGPVWLPLNYLLFESLQKHYYYYQDDLNVGGDKIDLYFKLKDLSNRLVDIFREQPTCSIENKECDFAARACHKGDSFQHEHPLFYEYFHGDSGKGLGASHQTGWTGLVAKLIQAHHENSIVH